MPAPAPGDARSPAVEILRGSIAYDAIQRQIDALEIWPGGTAPGAGSDESAAAGGVGEDASNPSSARGAPEPAGRAVSPWWLLGVVPVLLLLIGYGYAVVTRKRRWLPA